MGTLIATLGSEAQVVTLAVDLLALRGRPVDKIVVLHTSPRTAIIGDALRRLSAAVRDLPGARLTRVPLRDADGRPLDDVDTPKGANAVFRTLYRVIRAARRADERVDVCLAGGRKTMSVYAMVTAQMLFGDDDRLWHLVSYGELLAEKRMRVRPGDAAALIELPVIRLRDVAPAAALEMARADDPLAAVDRIQVRLTDLKAHRAIAFVQSALTPAERVVAGLVAREGLGDKQIAARLRVSPRTIQGHLGRIYRKAEEAFGVPQVSARALAGLLAPAALMDWVPPDG